MTLFPEVLPAFHYVGNVEMLDSLNDPIPASILLKSLQFSVVINLPFALLVSLLNLHIIILVDAYKHELLA